MNFIGIFEKALKREDFNHPRIKEVASSSLPFSHTKCSALLACLSFTDKSLDLALSSQIILRLHAITKLERPCLAQLCLMKAFTLSAVSSGCIASGLRYSHPTCSVSAACKGALRSQNFLMLASRDAFSRNSSAFELMPIRKLPHTSPPSADGLKPFRKD